MTDYKDSDVGKIRKRSDNPIQKPVPVKEEDPRDVLDKLNANWDYASCSQLLFEDKEDLWKWYREFEATISWAELRLEGNDMMGLDSLNQSKYYLSVIKKSIQTLEWEL